MQGNYKILNSVRYIITTSPEIYMSKVTTYKFRRKKKIRSEAYFCLVTHIILFSYAYFLRLVKFLD